MKKLRQKTYYDEMLTYDNILSVFYKIQKNCKNKRAVCDFYDRLNTNLLNILKILKSRNYKFSKYRIFLITDPKYRIIMSENINDKIVNHMVSKHILLPALESKLIDTNVATRINKGSRYAFEKFNQYLKTLLYQKKEIYVLKLDIKKYFYNIDHEILYNMIKKYIKEEDSLKIIKYIISLTNESYVNEDIYYIKRNMIKYITKSKLSQNEKRIKLKQIKEIPYYRKGRGLSLGNYSSQLLAIFYLNNVDHYIKEELHFKYFLKYMDDLLIIDTDKEKLKNAFNLIEKKINELKLELNSKSNIYKMSNGISFLGYKFVIKNNKIIIKYNNQTIRRIDRKLRNLKKYDEELYKKSYGSYQGYFKCSNTGLKYKYLK